VSVATRTFDSRSSRLDEPLATDAPRLATSCLRVVLGAKDPLYRAGIAHVLGQAEVDVVASASNADDLARKARAFHPDVAIVDIDMPPVLSVADRVEAARSIRSIDPRMAVLILTQLADERCALAILDDQAAGFGYLVKARIRDVEDFTESVRRVARGGSAIDPVVVGRLAGALPSRDPFDELTKRERQVLALVAEGRSNRFIASELVVTVSAVERHITSMFAKLGLCSNPADHRRVLAVLQYLAADPSSSGHEPN
jgi:DNA-binding NarL/FixJ family response regulator